MSWGLLNTWRDGKEGGYAVRHGQRPVRDFGQIYGTRDEACQDAMHGSNFFEKAYPCLFPWGRGGVESIRKTPVHFQDHVKWALRYHDRRFRKHAYFPFLVFGMLQHRQVLMPAKLQMKKRDYDRNTHLMASITLGDLQAAKKEEEQNRPISNPAVEVMKTHVLAMSHCV